VGGNTAFGGGEVNKKRLENPLKAFNKEMEPVRRERGNLHPIKGHAKGLKGRKNDLVTNCPGVVQ